MLVNRLAYDFGSPQRGQIVVFTAPPKANRCEPGDGGTTFVKRLIGLPGETVREDDTGFIWVRSSDTTTWTKLTEPYLPAQSRLADRTHFDHTWKRAAGRVLHARRQPGELVRLAAVGLGSEGQPDRPGDLHLLAAEPGLVPPGRVLARPGQTRSMTAAIAWPKPMHIVARP